MYIPVQSYVWYEALHQPGDWDGFYVRPPLMFNEWNVLLHLEEELARIEHQS